VIFSAENSNKYQKTRFWKEKSVEDVVTLGPAAQATLVLPEMRISSTHNSIFGFPNYFSHPRWVINYSISPNHKHVN
jgi:hypothetical protein